MKSLFATLTGVVVFVLLLRLGTTIFAPAALDMSRGEPLGVTLVVYAIIFGPIIFGSAYAAVHARRAIIGKK